MSKISKIESQYSTFMKTFLDLPKMFKYITTLQRGDLYRLLPYIVKEYNKNWDSTLDNNEYNDVRRFIALLKVYNVKHDIPKIDKFERRRKFIAHMFSSLKSRTTDIADKVDVTVTKVDCLVERMHEVLETSQNDIRGILSNLNTFTGLFVPSNNVWIEVVSYILKFAAFGYLLSQEQNRTIPNVLALLTLILPSGVGDCIISSLNRAIQGIWSKFNKQEDDKFVAMADETDSTIIAFFKVTCQLMKTMFTGIPSDTFKSMQLSIQKIKMVSEYLKSSSTIFDYIMRAFQECIKIIGNKLLKYYGKLPKFLQEDSLHKLIDEYVNIKENNYDVKAKTNSFYARKIVDVYNQALHAQAKMVKSKGRVDLGQARLSGYLSVMIRNLEPIVAKIPDHVKGTKNARRTKPFWLYIFGEPRIGKTSMFQPYVVNAVARCCGLIDKYRDYSEYTYFRNCGDEYWERYCGQPVLWYNDLFQVFTNEQKVNIGIEELTNVVDDNLYPLNMAFEEKHNVYFDSQLVISNAQDDITGKNFVTDKCLSQGEHIFARRNMVVRLRVDSKYKRPGGLNYQAMQAAKDAGAPYVGDLFPRDMYLVDFMDPLSGMLLQTMHFEQAIQTIINHYKAYQNHQNHFKDKLFKHFEEMWAQSDDEVHWQEALSNAAWQTWSCDECKDIYESTHMLNEDERNSIKTTLLLSCPHKEIKKVSRWQDFGDMVKVNIKAFFSTVKEFVVNNKMYLMLSAVLALVPVLFVLVNGYFSEKMFTQSHEGNIVTPKRQVTRLVAMEYTQQNKDIEAKLMRNIVLVSLYKDGENAFKMTLGSALGVGGDIFMMPKHFYDRFLQFKELCGDHTVRMSIAFNATQQFDIFVDDIKYLDVKYTHLADICFLQLNKLVCLPKLDKFFVSLKDEPVLVNSYLFGKRVDTGHVLHSLQLTNVKLSTREYTQGEIEIPYLSKFIPAKKIVLPEGYEFRVNGVAVGDCGLILMNTDEKMNARKIMGIHVAGSVKGNIGLANTVYQEDIQQAYELAGSFISMACLEVLSPDCSTSILKTPLTELFSVAGVYGDFQGKKVKLTIPMKTAISKSLFYDIMEQDFGPAKTAPARLRPFRVGDALVSPLLKGLAKMVKCTKNIPYRDIRHICDHMTMSIKDWYSDTPIRKLTLSEAINGLGNLNQIDVKTSAGFPYQLQQKTGGKRDWFTYNGHQLIPNQNLVDAILLREADAKIGIITPTFFVDTLKDETRTLDKVEQGKTRVFQVGPMCLSILMRQYFGSFIMHCQSTFINGEMGIGINANSYDWTMLLKRLMRVGDKFINGDYKDYDASMSQPFMMHVVEVVNSFYDLPYDHEDNVVRRVLFATFLNSNHIVEDLVFTRLQGNMSGIALTTIVNCLFNMFLLRYAYIKLVSWDLQLYHQQIQATFYGDDNLVCVSDDIVDRFNMFTYCQVMQTLNIEYTTADKTVMSVPYYDVTNISYLKRTFVKRGNIYYACLDRNTILEIPRWSESNPLNLTDQLNRFNCVLYELVNYGYDDYLKVFKILCSYVYLAKSQGYEINSTGLLTYPYILRSMFPQFFTSDLTRSLDHTMGLLCESGSNGSVKTWSHNLIDDGDSNCCTAISNNNNNLQIQSAEGKIARSHVQVTRSLVSQSNDEIRDLMDNITYAVNFQDEFKFIAMSTNQLQTMDENAGESIKRSQVTTTFDDTIPHETNSGEIPPPLVVNPYKGVDFDAFINREWYMTAIDWTSADDRKAIKQLVSLPIAAMSFIKAKLFNVAYWAPDIEITFRVNGTSMHYGRMMFAVVPSADIMHDAYLQPQNLSQWRFCQVSPTGNQTVTLKVPWIHYYDRIPITTLNSSTVPWRIFYWPAIPLSCATSTTPKPVTISVYSRITNPRFAGYTDYSPITDEFVAQSSEQVELSKNENVTGKQVQYGIIPIADTISRTVEKVAGDMSQLAMDIGYSNAPSLLATKPFQMRNIGLNRAEDLPLTINLGPSQNQGVEVNDERVNGAPNGMMISKIAGKMALLQTIKIPVDISPGQNVAAFELRPTQLFYHDYSTDLAPAANTIYPLPAHYLARLFTLWRGGFKFHVSFVCSAFHSMRIRMCYRPYMASGSQPTPSAGSSAYNVNELWDINNQTDYSFRIPFFQWSEWLGLSQCSGYLIMTAMTKVSSTAIGDVPTQPIYMQIWAAMDDDFQLAYPFISTAGTAIGEGVWMSNPDIGGWVKENDSVVKKTELALISENEALVAQSDDSLMASGNPMLNYRSMQFPSMSNDGLESIKYPPIGGVTDKHKSIRYATAFEFASVKEIANMLTPIERHTVTTKTDPIDYATYANAGRKLAPFAWMDRGANDPMWYNYFFQVMAIFRYARGSVRFAAISDRAVAATGNLGAMQSAWDGSVFTEYTTDVFFDGGNLSEITSGSHLFSNLQDQPADITIPYYSQAKCVPQTYNVSKGTPPAFPVISHAPAFTDGSLLLRFPIPAKTAKGAEVGKIVWLVAGGDDLQLGYQTAVPRCRYGPEVVELP